MGLGEVDDGLRKLDEAAVAAVGGEIEGYKAVAAICCFVVFASERVRDIERASQWCEQYMGYCNRNDMPRYLAFCRAHHASVLAVRGHWDEAEGELVEGLLDRVPDADRVERLAALEVVAGLRCAAGDVEAGEEAVAEFEAVAEAAGTDWLEGTASHLRGRLALAGGDPAAARALLQRALDAYRRVDLPYETALVRADLARALHALERDGSALEHARAAGATLERLGATVEAGKARATMDELSPTGRSEADGLLTPREAEVLRLLATRGATNQEIADELDQLIEEVDSELSDPGRWGLTFTLVQAWGQRSA